MLSYDEFYAAFRPPKVRMAAMDLLLFHSSFQESYTRALVTFNSSVIFSRNQLCQLLLSFFIFLSLESWRGPSLAAAGETRFKVHVSRSSKCTSQGESKTKVSHYSRLPSLFSFLSFIVNYQKLFVPASCRDSRQIWSYTFFALPPVPNPLTLTLLHTKCHLMWLSLIKWFMY